MTIFLVWLIRIFHLKKIDIFVSAENRMLHAKFCWMNELQTPWNASLDTDIQWVEFFFYVIQVLYSDQFFFPCFGKHYNIIFF